MSEHQPSVRPGWKPLPHASPPRPTYFPAGVALGVAFIFWGLLTSVVVLGIGVAIFGVTLAGWIREIRHERRDR